MPRLLVPLSAQTSTLHKPKLHSGDFVRIDKKDKTFRKGCWQSFTDEVFEMTDFLTLSPPMYSFLDAKKGKTEEGNFYPLELQLVGERNKQNDSQKILR